MVRLLSRYSPGGDPRRICRRGVWWRRLVEVIRTALGGCMSDTPEMVHGLLLAKVRREEADDLVQEVFLIAMRRISALRDPNRFGAWLSASARNLANDHYRRMRPTASLMEDPTRDGRPNCREPAIWIRALGDRRTVHRRGSPRNRRARLTWIQTHVSDWLPWGTTQCALRSIMASFHAFIWSPPGAVRRRYTFGDHGRSWMCLHIAGRRFGARAC